MAGLQDLLDMIGAKKPEREVIGSDTDLAAQAMALEDEEASTARDFVAPQETPQAAVNAELNSQVSSANASADSGLQQPKSLQDLMGTYLGGREKHVADLKSAREDDKHKNLIASLAGNLSDFSRADSQMKVGQQLKGKDIKTIKADSAKDVASDRSTELNELLTAKKLQDALKDDKGLSEYQKGMLDLKKRGLDIKEKSASQKAKEGTVTSAFKKEKMKAFGKGAAEFYQMTRPQLLANLPKIDKAIELLNKDKKLTGGLTSRVIGDTALKLRDPKAYIVQQSMQSAITDTLRPTLGAQFTEKEGERIMNLTFDPAVSTKENALRARALQKVIKDKVKFSEALYAHLDKHGDDEGFDYKTHGMTKGTTSESTKAEPGQIRRKMKDGKIAIFDEATKEFIKYE